MSLTGAPDGEPMKVGIGIADVMCGMYATVGILAALRHKERTGEGQHVELALVDTQIAWLINEGVSYLTTGELPVTARQRPPDHRALSGLRHVRWPCHRRGRQRRPVPPLRTLSGAHESWADDRRFATNPARVENAKRWSRS